MLLGGPSSETWSHPIDMNMREPKIISSFCARLVSVSLEDRRVEMDDAV
jgi:hypothetical protein